MKNKVVTTIIFSVLLTNMLTLALNIQPVKATLYITSDFTFTEDLYEPIVVLADNIVIDGNEYTLQGTGAYGSTAIDITGRNNVTIKNLTITQFFFAIWLNGTSNSEIVGNTITDDTTYGVTFIPSCSNNTISGNTINTAKTIGSVASMGINIYHMSNNNSISENTITNSKFGLYLNNCSNNNIVGNTITNNGFSCVHIKNLANNNTFSGNTITYSDSYGIYHDNSSYNNFTGNTLAHNSVGAALFYSNNTIFSENNITDNTQPYACIGIQLSYSYNNQFFHNNFKDNPRTQVRVAQTGLVNIWDNGTEGNYWSDYTGPDANGDGIGDTPYVIDADNEDRYPLMTPRHGRTLTVNYVGSGSVSLNDTGPYVHGTIVELTALPAVGWEFTGWSGDLSGSNNQETIVMDGNKTVNANFVELTYTLTVNVVGSGSVSKTPDQATYNYGDVVGLDATADPGWSFDSWSGDLSGSTNPDSVTILGETSVTATFTEIPPEEALVELIETVEIMNLPIGTETSLTRKLDASLALLTRGNENGAIHKLMDFINQVESQRGIMITDEQADQLISEAQRIANQIQQ